MVLSLVNIYQKREADSRSVSAENFRGAKGAGGKATFDTSFHKGFARAGNYRSAWN